MRASLIVFVALVLLAGSAAPAYEKVRWVSIVAGGQTVMVPVEDQRPNGYYDPPIATDADVNAAEAADRGYTDQRTSAAVQDAITWANANVLPRLSKDEQSMNAAVAAAVTSKFDDNYKQSIISAVAANVAQQLSDPNGAFYKDLLRKAKLDVCASLAASHPTMKCAI